MTTLHLVSHTHWDREWYLTFQQFRFKLVHLIDHLLELLDRDPDFKHFMLDGQTILLEDYLEVRPEREADLRRHLQTGRLLAGPWYVLPDEFLVSPEAIIRNLLAGRRLCARFGPAMRLAYNPDAFGHIGQMPQIARGFGFEAASLWRGMKDEPCEVWWQAPDGSRVLLAYLREGYGHGAGLPVEDAELFHKAVLEVHASLAPHAQVSHLLIMHGMDHMEPPAFTSRAVVDFNRLQGDGAFRLVHSTLPDYLDAIWAEIQQRGLQLPVVEGELRSCQRAPLLPGVLSTRMWIKQRNHACQTLLENWAEPFSALASLLMEENAGALDREAQALLEARLQHPEALLRQAWRLLLQCHPHDSICGCSIDQVHEEMRPRFDQVEQIGEEITRQSLQTLAGLTDTLPAGMPDVCGAILVYNPSDHPRTDCVQAEIQLPQGAEWFAVVDEAGRELAVEVQGSHSQELIRMSLSPEEFKSSLAMAANGRVMNWVIRGMNLAVRGEEAHLDLVFSEAGEPDLPAIRQAQENLQALLQEAEIRRYVVRAVSSPASKITLLAEQVPGPGWRTFWVRARPAEQEGAAMARLNPAVRLLLPLARRLGENPLAQKILLRLAEPDGRRPPARIENERFVVEFSRFEGTVTVLDRRTGQVYRGLNAFVDGGDCGDEYNYCPPAKDRLFRSPRLRGFRVERSELRQTLHLSLRLPVARALAPDRSRRLARRTFLEIETRLTLLKGGRRIEVHTEVNNTAQDHRLRVHFPFPFAVETAYYDGHFEIVQRPISGSPDGNLPYPDESWPEQPRGEVPQRHFTALVGEKAGLLIASRGLPEVAVLSPSEGRREIALTLLRCVGWLSRDDLSTRKGHAGPALAVPGAQMLGRYAFEYAIIPFAPGEELLAYREAYAFSAPLRAVAAGLHPGALAGRQVLIQTSPAEFVLSAVKTAEDGAGWVVRGYNISAKQIEVSLKPWRLFAKVSRVNLAEEAQGSLLPEADGTVKLSARPFEIVTVKFADR